MLTRYRVQLMGDRTRETMRLELMLEDASIKLSVVASSLTTKSAREMLGAMINGERNRRVLADLAKRKMRVRMPALAESLAGFFDAQLAQLARSILTTGVVVSRASRWRTHRRSCPAAAASRDLADADRAVPTDQCQATSRPVVRPEGASGPICHTGADLSS